MQDLDTLLLINTTLSRASTVVGPALRVEYAQDAAGLLAFICGKALPPVLLSLEPLYKAQAKGRKDKLQPTLQALDAELQTVLLVLEHMDKHSGNGVVGLLSLYPSLWLGFFHSLRRIRSHLQGFCTVASECLSGKHSTDLLSVLVKAISDLDNVCSRAREVAQLWGSDLRTVSASHTPAVLAARVGCNRCSPNAAAASTSQPASAAASRAESMLLSSMPTRISSSSSASASSSCAVCVAAPSSHRTGASSLAKQPSLPAAGSCFGVPEVDTTVTRVMGVLLWDSEEDQLEQDRAFLRERIGRLRADPQTPPEVLAEAYILQQAVVLRLEELALGIEVAGGSGSVGNIAAVSGSCYATPMSTVTGVVECEATCGSASARQHRQHGLLDGAADSFVAAKPRLLLGCLPVLVR